MAGSAGGSAGVAYMLAPHEVVQAFVQRSTRRQKREARLREVLARQVLKVWHCVLVVSPNVKSSCARVRDSRKRYGVLLGRGRRETVAHFV